MARNEAWQSVQTDVEITDLSGDLLSWQTKARRLAQYIMFKVNTPMTVGIQGTWGSGKTSFINLVVQSLGRPVDLQPANEQEEADDAKKYPLADQLEQYHAVFDGAGANAFVLRFDSWAFAQTAYTVDELFPVYVEEVLQQFLSKYHPDLKPETPIAKKLTGFFKSSLRLGVRMSATFVPGQTGLAEVAGDAIDTLLDGKADEAANSIALFKPAFQELVDRLLNVSDHNYADRLIIIVDDLDRIAPLDALALTEKLKVFLDVRGVVFLLAADLKIIQLGLRAKFGADPSVGDGKRYLDKIVKLQFNVPQLTPIDLVRISQGYPLFLASFNLDPNRPRDELEREAPYRLFALMPSISANIRNTKRVLLNFEFIGALLNERSEEALAIGLANRLLTMLLLHQYNHELALAFHEFISESAGAKEPLLSGGVADDLQQKLVALLATEDEKNLIGHLIKQYINKWGYKIAEWNSVYSTAVDALAT